MLARCWLGVDCFDNMCAHGIIMIIWLRMGYIWVHVYERYVDCRCDGRHFHLLCLDAFRCRVVTAQIELSSADIGSLIIGNLHGFGPQGPVFNFPKGNESCCHVFCKFDINCPVGG